MELPKQQNINKESLEGHCCSRNSSVKSEDTVEGLEQLNNQDKIKVPPGINEHIDGLPEHVTEDLEEMHDHTVPQSLSSMELPVSATVTNCAPEDVKCTSMTQAHVNTEGRNTPNTDDKCPGNSSSCDIKTGFDPANQEGNRHETDQLLGEYPEDLVLGKDGTLCDSAGNAGIGEVHTATVCQVAGTSHSLPTNTCASDKNISEDPSATEQYYGELETQNLVEVPIEISADAEGFVDLFVSPNAQNKLVASATGSTINIVIPEVENAGTSPEQGICSGRNQLTTVTEFTILNNQNHHQSNHDSPQEKNITTAAASEVTDTPAEKITLNRSIFDPNLSVSIMEGQLTLDSDKKDPKNHIIRGENNSTNISPPVSVVPDVNHQETDGHVIKDSEDLVNIGNALCKTNLVSSQSSNVTMGGSLSSSENNSKDERCFNAEAESCPQEGSSSSTLAEKKQKQVLNVEEMSTDKKEKPTEHHVVLDASNTSNLNWPNTDLVKTLPVLSDSLQHEPINCEVENHPLVVQGNETLQIPEPMVNHAGSLNATDANQQPTQGTENNIDEFPVSDNSGSPELHIVIVEEDLETQFDESHGMDGVQCQDQKQDDFSSRNGEKKLSVNFGSPLAHYTEYSRESSQASTVVLSLEKEQGTPELHSSPGVSEYEQDSSSNPTYGIGNYVDGSIRSPDSTGVKVCCDNCNQQQVVPKKLEWSGSYCMECPSLSVDVDLKAESQHLESSASYTLHEPQHDHVSMDVQCAKEIRAPEVSGHRDSDHGKEPIASDQMLLAMPLSQEFSRAEDIHHGTKFYDAAVPGDRFLRSDDEGDLKSELQMLIGDHRMDTVEKPEVTCSLQDDMPMIDSSGRMLTGEVQEENDMSHAFNHSQEEPIVPLRSQKDHSSPECQELHIRTALRTPHGENASLESSSCHLRVETTGSSTAVVPQLLEPPPKMGRIHDQTVPCTEKVSSLYEEEDDLVDHHQHSFYGHEGINSKE